MVAYLLDFHENIRFSKTLGKYQEQPYLLEKTTNVFLDPSKKNACNIRRILMEQSGNIPVFNIPGILFRNIPRNSIGNFFRIYWEYLMGMFHEYSIRSEGISFRHQKLLVKNFMYILCAVFACFCLKDFIK